MQEPSSKKLILAMSTLALLIPSVGMATTTPVHRWNFDESSGGVVYDSMGTAQGVIGTSGGWTSGIVGSGAVSLAANSTYDLSSYVDFGQEVAQFGTADFTISTWYQTTFNTIGKLGDVLGTRDDASHGNFIAVRVRGDGSLTVELDQDGAGTNYAGASSSTASRVNDGRWHHLAVTRSGATVTLYIDGVNAASASTSSGQPTNVYDSSSFRLGRRLPNCCSTFYSVPAKFDDLRIYDQALGSTEIAQLAASNTTMFLKNIGQNLFLNVNDEGSYWPARFYLQADADDVWKMEDTAYGPNVKTFTSTILPGVCSDGYTRTECPDNYRLCAYNSSGYRAYLSLSDAWVGTPSTWNGPECAWIVEDLGNGEFKMRSYWHETTARSYVGYLRCNYYYDCTFDYGSGTDPNSWWKSFVP